MVQRSVKQPSSKSIEHPSSTVLSWSTTKNVGPYTRPNFPIERSTKLLLALVHICQLRLFRNSCNKIFTILKYYTVYSNQDSCYSPKISPPQPSIAFQFVKNFVATYTIYLLLAYIRNAIQWKISFNNIWLHTHPSWICNSGHGLMKGCFFM